MIGPPAGSRWRGSRRAVDARREQGDNGGARSSLDAAQRCGGWALTATRHALRSAVPGTRGPWWQYVVAAVCVALIAALTTPLWVSGWRPWGQSGPAAVPADPAGPFATDAQETPGRFHDDVLRATWSGSAAWPLAPVSGTVTVDAWVGRAATPIRTATTTSCTW